MRKKLFLGSFLVLILMVLPLLIGCGGGTEVKSGGQEDKTEKPQVFEITASHTMGANVPMAKQFKEWGDTIEKESGGRVKFTFFWSNTLMPQNDLFKGLSTGVADISYATFNIKLMPLSAGITQLPFMGYPSMEAESQIFMKLYEKFPEIRQEFEKLGVAMTDVASMPAVQIHSNKLVKAPSDMKGLKIGAGPGPLSDLVALAGAAPVEVQIGDQYMSLETGVIEGINNHFPLLDALGTLPLVKYHTIVGEGGISMMQHAIMWNPDSLAKFPPDVRKIIDDATKVYHDRLVKNDSDLQANLAKKAQEELKHTVTYLTPDEVQVWQDFAKPVHEKWIKQMEADGHKAVRAIYDEAKRLIAEYK